MKTGRKLFWQVTAPLAATFALLWLGIMALITERTCETMEIEVSRSVGYAEEEIEQALENYRLNLEEGRDTTATLLRGLNFASLRLSDWDGGMGILLQGEEKSARSQLAWGFGSEEDFGEGPYWYLELDGGLDDAGQKELAEWIMARRSGWSYCVYPPGSPVAVGEPDGTYARAAGWAEEGNVLRVRKLELVHPDGTAETVVETSLTGEPSRVVELRYLELSSVLLPNWWTNSEGGYNGRTDMDRRLENFRSCQETIDRELAGEERPVRDRNGVLSTARMGAMTKYRAYQCDVFPSALRQNGPLYISSLLLTALVLLLLARHLARRVTAPVEVLSARAGAGEPCPEDGPVKELNALAVSFNAARDQLADRLERERDFTRAAAHELKTPLAVLRAHGEALREDIDAQKREQYLDVILDECDRMSALVGSLLELSRLEAGAGLRREEVELSGLTRAVWAPLALPLERKGVSLALELEEVRLAGDRERLREAAGNLASNALRHCVSGGTIRVTLKKEGNRAVLAVYNDGPPIPADDLPHLFEPFYRGDKSRSRDSGGTGLGLAIVRAAARAHGGECGAENTGSGVTFRLTLPLDG